MIPVLKRAEILPAETNMRSVRRYMQPGEMEVFLALAALAKPYVVVEFGVNEGITANEMLLHFIDIERYVGIEVPLDYAISEQQWQEVPLTPGRLVEQDPRFELIVRRNGSLDLTPVDLPMCDVAYIDGDHRENVVLHDSLLARRIVRPGGMIIWHDASNEATPDVLRVLEHLNGLGWAIKTVETTWLAFMKV